MTGDMNIIKYVNLIIFDFSGRTHQPEFSVLVMSIYSMNIIVTVKLLALSNVLCFQIDV